MCLVIATLQNGAHVPLMNAKLNVLGK